MVQLKIMVMTVRTVSCNQLHICLVLPYYVFFFFKQQKNASLSSIEHQNILYVRTQGFSPEYVICENR